MMVASFLLDSHRDPVVVHFSLVLFGATGSFVTESGMRLRMLSPMISQIDIAVVKLSHDVVSGGVSAACTYVDLILDIFVFFSCTQRLCFTSFHFRRNLLDFIVFHSLFVILFHTHPSCLSQHNFLPFACLPNNFGSIVSQISRAVHFQCNRNFDSSTFV